MEDREKAKEGLSGIKAKRPKPGHAKFIKALIVEDDPTSSRLLVTMLSTAKPGGFKVESSSSLDAAFKLLDKNSFDVVLLDLNLPDSRGLDGLNKMVEKYPDVAIVVITGAYGEKVGLQAMASGAEEYLTKGKYDGHTLEKSIYYAIERKRTEEALRESEEEFMAIFNSVKDGMVLLDMTGKIVKINKALIEAGGYGEEEVIGKRFDLLKTFTPQSLAKMASAFAKIVSGREAPIYEVEGYTKRGEKKIAEIHSSILRKRGKPAGVITVMRDITERKQAEEALKNAYVELKDSQGRLMQSEKLAALGKFSSDIAHEIKNPLGIILVGIEFLEKILPDAQEQARAAIKKIKESTLRADTVVRRLLEFTRPSELRIEKVDPNDLINDTLSLVKYRVSLGDIEIKTKFTRNKICIGVDRNQIQQVLFNVLINAVESMPAGGVVKVRVRERVSSDSIPDKSTCLIGIADTGEGISKENLSKIFEPFFTTKRDKKGTGLGLSMAKMIIDNHKGDLRIESEPGKGTKVEIILPVVE